MGMIEVTHVLWVYLSPWIVVGGLVGNFLSLAVMVRGDSHSLTTRLYLGVLSVVDMVIILTYLGVDWMRHAFGVDLRSVSKTFLFYHLSSLVY